MCIYKSALIGLEEEEEPWVYKIIGQEMITVICYNTQTHLEGGGGGGLTPPISGLGPWGGPRGGGGP